VLVVAVVALVIPIRGLAQPARFDETISRLRSPDARERLDALRLLREAAYPEAIAPVGPLVSDIDDRVQLAAIAAEVRFFLAEGNEKTTILDAFAGVPFSTYPRRVPADLRAALLRAIGDETRQVRTDAAYALGAIERPGLSQADASALVAALRHPDPATRAAAARVCGRLQVREAGDALVNAMNDRDADARLAAIWAIGELRVERGVQALTEFAAHYGSSEAGRASLAALARIAHPSSAPVFRAALAGGAVEIRLLGAEGAARLRDQAALPQIEQALAGERDARAQAALLFALNALGRRQAESLAMLLAEPRAFPFARNYLRELGDRAIPALVPQLEHENADVRRGVVDVLGAIGGPDMANTIWTLQQDPEQTVRDATARALERLEVRATNADSGQR
jgi:HEAT repeat protein